MTIVPVWPLHRLTELNIQDGCDLGLLNAGGAAPIRAQLATMWESAFGPADEIATFRKAGRILWSELTCWADWRHCSEPLFIQRVMAAADLDRLQGPLDATRDGARGLIRAPFDEFVDLIRRLEQPGAVGESPDDELEHERQIERLLEECRVKLCPSPNFAFAKVPASSLHLFGDHTWITVEPEPPAEPAPAALQSQHVRDALGLIHLPNRRMNQRRSLQSLVLLTFSIELSPEPPPRTPRGFLAEETDPAKRRSGAWLIRPTVCEQPNHRFAQRHSHDRDRQPHPTGYTINIGNDDYAEGWPELVLVHRPETELSWHDLEFLGPPVETRAYDHNHGKFVHSISTRPWRVAPAAP